MTNKKRYLVAGLLFLTAGIGGLGYTLYSDFQDREQKFKNFLIENPFEEGQTPLTDKKTKIFPKLKSLTFSDEVEYTIKNISPNPLKRLEKKIINC